MATKLIIITNVSLASRTVANYILRASVPAARQSFYANANYVSIWVNPLGADSQDQLDLTALKAGQIIESAGVYTDPMATGSAQTKPQVLAALQALQAAYQAQVTAETGFSYYGSSWNGTTWTQVGA